MKKDITLFGDYVELNKNHTEEELMSAREKVIEMVCNEIRRLARETPERVFIEKDSRLKTDIKTVACKVEIITT